MEAWCVVDQQLEVAVVVFDLHCIHWVESAGMPTDIARDGPVERLAPDPLSDNTDV